MDFTIRQVACSDKGWVQQVFEEQWGADLIVARGRCYKSSDVEGVIAERGGDKIGLITYSQTGNEIEIITLNSFEEKKGIGSALVEAVVSIGRNRKAKKVSVITSNDNLYVLGFYQKRQFSLVCVRRNAIEETRRRFKPGIPLIGENGIPLRDEIEFERVLE